MGEIDRCKLRIAEEATRMVECHEDHGNSPQGVYRFESLAQPC